MAHFARIDEHNVVQEIIVVDNKDCKNKDFPESEKIGQEFLKKLGLHGKWKQTSYNGNFRERYAGLGSKYIQDVDIFTEPQPFSSWKLNPKTYKWESPTPMPKDKSSYYWDEKIKNWKKEVY